MTISKPANFDLRGVTQMRMDPALLYELERTLPCWGDRTAGAIAEPVVRFFGVPVVLDNHMPDDYIIAESPDRIQVIRIVREEKP
jgi:hypothetical protein